MLRIASLLAALTFTGFAVVQWNDPGPFLWVALYLYPAVLAAFTYRGKRPFKAALAGLVAFMALFAYWQPGNLDSNWIKAEEWREAMGLALCAVWCLVVAVASYTRNTRKRSL